jgi:hypothetical protein
VGEAGILRTFGQENQRVEREGTAGITESPRNILTPCKVCPTVLFLTWGLAAYVSVTERRVLLQKSLREAQERKGVRSTMEPQDYRLHLACCSRLAGCGGLSDKPFPVPRNFCQAVYVITLTLVSCFGPPAA